MAQAKTCGAYDRFITNDDLDRAIREAVDTVTAERARRRWG
jgi:guanylate kinase